MANRTAALARASSNPTLAAPGHDGGKAFQNQNDHNKIIHVDGNGRETTWTLDQLKREYGYPADRRQPVPLSVRIEYARIRLATGYKREDFLRDIFPELGLDSKLRYELAQLYLYSTPEMGDCIGLVTFAIHDADQQLALAQTCIDRRLNLSPIFTAALSQVSPAQRRELAFQLVESDPKLPLHVDSIALAPADWSELVLRIARHGGSQAVLLLPDACFADKRQAQAIAEACGPYVLDSLVLQRIGLSGDEVFELARQLARHRSLDLSEHLADIDFFTNGQKAQLMEDCLRAGGPVSNVRLVEGQSFSPDLCFRWALACAGHEPEAVARRFPALEIKDPQLRLQIARACVERNADGVGRYLGNFELQAKGDLHALVLDCARDGPSVLDAVSQLELDLPQKLEILRTCAVHPGFGKTVPIDPLRVCNREQRLEVVGLVVQRDAKEAVSLISRLVTAQLLTSDEVMPALRLCVSNGCRPKHALHAIGMSESESHPLAMAFLGLWLQSGASVHAVQKECWRHQLAFDGDGCLHFLRPLQERQPLPFRHVGDRLAAIGGQPEFGLSDMNDNEIALLAMLAQGEKSFRTFFVETKNGSGQWQLKETPSFTNVIGKLRKRHIDMDAAQCGNALARLKIAGSFQQVAQTWKAIGQHAHTVEAFRALATMQKPADLPQPEPSDAQGLTWTENQQRWLASVMILIEVPGLDNEHVQLLLPLLERLAVMRDESNRRTLTRLIMEASKEELARLKDATAADVLTRFCMLPFLDANPWLRSALDGDAKKDKRIKNYEVARPLMESFSALRQFPLPLATQNALLGCIAPPGGNDLRIIGSQVQKLVTLLRLSYPVARKLLDEGSSHTLDGLLRSALSDVLRFPSDFDLDRYLASFGSMREPGTLPSYASRLTSQPHALKGLGKFVEAVLSEDYPAIRYRGIEMLEKVSPAWLQRWQTEKIGSSEGKPLLFVASGASAPPSPAQVLKSRMLQHGHLDLAAFPHLASHLTVQGPATEEATRQPISPFEQAMIGWLQVPDPARLDELAQLLYREQPHAELRNDIDMLRADRDSAEVVGPRTGWTMRFTDDFEQLLRMGTDVAGSCQRIEGNPRINRGLIGTILDGRSRLCTIEDETGRIQGRLVLRLVWNEQENKPCLLAEPIYPDTLNRQLREKLTGFARDRARELQLDLVCFSKPFVEPDFVVDESADRFTAKLSYGSYEYPPYADSSTNGVIENDTGPNPKLTWWRAYRHKGREALEVAV